MLLFRKILMYVPEAATGLCRNCSWGTLRKGFSPAEVEVFCRIVGPENRVRFAVRECTSYCDRRPPETVAESRESRRYGFVTEIQLGNNSETITPSLERPKAGD